MSGTTIDRQIYGFLGLDVRINMGWYSRKQILTAHFNVELARWERCNLGFHFCFDAECRQAASNQAARKRKQLTKQNKKI